MTSADETLAKSTIRRVTLRLMPFLFVLYFIAYLDRVNVSFASLQMTNELGMSHQAFGFGAGIFFLGYFLLEIPGAVIVETWSARKWIARIMITWGMLAAATGFVETERQFFTIRFFLGMAEAGFFPGMMVYLSHWFPAADRAKAVAMFMIAIPMSEIIGAPVSALLMKIHAFGMAGWRWLLILEGLPAIVFGIVTLFYLTDRPSQARWLTDEQRDWLTRTLEAEGKSRHTLKVWQGLTDKRTLLLMGAYFAMLNLGYAIIMWLPKILQASFGKGTSTTILLTAVPFLIGAPVALMVAWHSDKTNERRWHAAGPLFAGSLALLLFPWAHTTALLALPCFAIAVAGGQSARAPFWAIATTLLSGRAAAASVGLINSFGNLGGFVGPYTVGWLATHTEGFQAGVLYMVFSSAASAILILLAGRSAVRQQAKIIEMRNRVEGVQGEAIP